MSGSRDNDGRRPDARWTALMADVRAGLEANRLRAAECALNRCYLSGETNIAWRKGVVRLKDRQEPEDDRLLQQYRWLRRKLFKTKPQLTAHAGGFEVVDAQRAAVAERVFDYWRANNGWLEAEQDAYRWVFPAGRAFIEPVWTSVARTVEREQWELLPEPEVETRPGGRRVKRFHRRTRTTAAAGDIVFRLLDPNGVFLFPLAARRWEEVERILSIDLVTRGALEEMLGEAVPDDIQPWRREDVDAHALDSLRAMTGNEWAVPPDDRDELFLLVQSRERPDLKRPDGRLVVAAGGCVLRDESLPYAAEAREIDPTGARNLAMGVVPWFAERVIGSLQPPAPATILRRKQRQIVELMRLIAENRRNVALNKILAPEGAFDEQKWSDQNGQILRYNRSQMQSPPQLIQGQPLAGAMAELEDARRSFDESAGRPTVLRGENPPQVRGAFHFEMLYEEASELLALDVQTRERVHENTGLLALAIWRRRAPRAEVERIYGKERAAHVWLWMTLDIPADLRIQEGSAMPRNYAAKEAKVVELQQYNAFRKPDGSEDTETFWQMLELGQLNRAVQARHMTRLAAENAFARMLYAPEAEAVAMPQEWEDHAVFLQVFREQMVRPEFAAAPPARRAAILAHLAMRAEMLAAQFTSLPAPAGEVPASPGAQGPGGAAPATPPAGLPPMAAAAG